MKVKGLRWWVIALVALATVINYIDRTCIWCVMARDGQGFIS